MAEYIEREAVLAEYDRQHQGPPGGARKIIAEWPAADVAPVDRWIPVTERMPDSGVHVLACCRVKWIGGGGRSYVCDAFHTAHKSMVCGDYDTDDIDLEYDEDTDEYYMPEGWWEVIKNWGDYSCVAIDDIVTHWMPLPEPPEEDDERLCAYGEAKA